MPTPSRPATARRATSPTDRLVDQVRTLQQDRDDLLERVRVLEALNPRKNIGYGYEIARELLRPADFANYFADSSTIVFGDYGGTGALMTLGDALNDEIVFAMRLGPRGAMYHLQFICQTAPDGGVFEFQWATIPGTPDEGDSFPTALASTVIPADVGLLDGLGATYSPLDTENILTYLSIADWTGIGDPGDLYSAVTANNQIGGGGGGSPGSRYQQFRIMGQPGDQLTTVTAPNAGLAFGGFDSGPGIYLLKVKVIDQNPSSSGFAIRLSSLTIQREFFDNFSF